MLNLYIYKKIIIIIIFTISHHTLAKVPLAENVFEAIKTIFMQDDNGLRPELFEMIYASKTPILENNAFIYALAYGHQTQSPYQKGMEVYQKLQKSVQSNQYSIPDTNDKVLHYPDKSFFNESQLHCYRREPDCFANILNSSTAVKKFVEKNHPSIQWYLDFLSHDIYQTVQKIDFDTETPKLWHLYHHQSVYHLNLLQQLQQQKTFNIINKIAVETMALRRLMASADEWHSKKVFKDLLEECYEFLNHLRLHNLLEIPKTALTMNFLQPLSKEEISVYKPVETHLQMLLENAYTLAKTHKQANFHRPDERTNVTMFLWSFFFKPNSTFNTEYTRYVKPLLDLSHLNAYNFYHKDKTLPIKQHQHDMIRNPLGASYFRKMVTPNQQNYKTHHQFYNLDMKIALFRALVAEESAKEIINKAQKGKQQYLNHLDRSIPYIQNNKLCYSGPHKSQENNRCLTISNAY